LTPSATFCNLKHVAATASVFNMDKSTTHLRNTSSGKSSKRVCFVFASASASASAVALRLRVCLLADEFGVDSFRRFT